MTKHEIAEVLDEIGVLLELKGENPFKVRAYHAGARALETLEEDLDTVVAEGRLQSIKGIGEALAKKITELHATGRLEFFEKLKAVDRSRAGRDAGDSRAGREEDQGAARAAGDQLDRGPGARVRGGPGGRRWMVSGRRPRRRSWPASGIARRTDGGTCGGTASAWPSRSCRGCARCRRCGGRNMRAACGAGSRPWAISISSWRRTSGRRSSTWFTARPEVEEVTAQGETKASVRFAGGLQADLRIVPAGPVCLRPAPFHRIEGSQRADAPAARRPAD